MPKKEQGSSKQSLLKSPQQIKKEMEAGAELSPQPIQNKAEQSNTQYKVQKAKQNAADQNIGGGWGVDGAFLNVQASKAEQHLQNETASPETDVVNNQPKSKKK